MKRRLRRTLRRRLDPYAQARVAEGADRALGARVDALGAEVSELRRQVAALRELSSLPRQIAELPS